MLVTVSSVGAGAIGVATLLFLYPKVPTSKIVGIDIAHAIPLTLVAGVGHLLVGTVNFGILLSLLSGSIPGIILGSWLSPVAPEKILRPGVALLLGFVGFTMFYPHRWRKNAARQLLAYADGSSAFMK